jgi:hypothetical protein
MPVVVIRALREGFRRAGVAHSATPVQHADGTFTAGQLAALRAEPMLVVDTVTASSVNARVDHIIRGMHFRDFTVDGKPKLDALNALLREAELAPVTAAERDAAVVRLLALTPAWSAPANPD